MAVKMGTGKQENGTKSFVRNDRETQSNIEWFFPDDGAIDVKYSGHILQRNRVDG